MNMNQLRINLFLALLLGCLCPENNSFAQRARRPTKSNVPEAAAARDTAPGIPPPRDTTQVPPHLIVLVRNYGDSVVLRWSPDRAGHFLAGTKAGYWVERVELSAQNPRGKKVLLSPVPVKPWPLEEARRRVKPTDQYPAIALQMVYGQNFTKTFTPDPASIIKLSEEQNNRFGVALLAADYSPLAADALGLRWVDRLPRQPGAIYTYRIYSAIAKPTINDLRDTASVTVSARAVFKPEVPLIDVVENGDSVITLNWNQRTTQGSYSGFHVERSEDGKRFKRLTEAPYFQSKPDEAIQKRDSLHFRPDRKGSTIMSYTDSVKVNYKKFYYRIFGVDAFGDLSLPSELLVGMGIDLTPPLAPSKLRTQVIDNKSVKIQWSKNLIVEKDEAGYVVGRSRDVNGPFEPLIDKILPLTALEYTDTKPLPYGNYYTVGAIDTVGNVSFALPVVGIIADLLPPPIPTGLTAKTDTNGVVELAWPLGEEDDIVSYMVYRSYERDNEFYRQLTSYPIESLTHLDTLPLPILNKVVYYKIVAIDRTGNHSALSAPLEVRVPDKLPPTAPVVRDVVVDAGGVTLEVIPSSSVDVVAHRLYRREGEGTWALLRELPGSVAATLNLRDTTLQGQPDLAQKKFSYALTAVDEAGLESPKSFAVPVQFGPAPAIPVKKLLANFDANRQAVTLRWEFPKEAEPYHFVVYRSLNDEGLMMYKAVESDQRHFQDTALAPTGRYQYAIRVQYYERGGSVLSPVVSVSK